MIATSTSKTWKGIVSIINPNQTHMHTKVGLAEHMSFSKFIYYVTILLSMHVLNMKKIPDGKSTFVNKISAKYVFRNKLLRMRFVCLHFI